MLSRARPPRRDRATEPRQDGGTVSAILPTFNSRLFVARAIDSVLAQQGPHLRELIVVDDCSSDGTAEFIRNSYRADSRVKVLTSEQNRGPGAARNKAISAAEGQWIALIDADDAWAPERLNRLLGSEEQEVDLIFDNVLGYDQFRSCLTGALYDGLPEKLSFIDMAKPGTSNRKFDFGYLKAVISRDFIERQRIKYAEIRVNEDLIFYLEALINRPRVLVIQEAYYIYTTPVGQLSRSRSLTTASVPDDLSAARLLNELSAKYSFKISAEERKALHLRAREFRNNFTYSRLYDHWAKRKYMMFLRQLVSHPRLIYSVAKKVKRKIFGR